MKVKINSQQTILLIIILIVTLTSFIPAKYTKDFKKQKKQISSLTLISPIVTIISNNGIERYVDTVSTKANQILIKDFTNELLSHKYKIENVKTPKINILLLNKILSKLEDSPNELTKNSYKPIQKEIDLRFKNRYALLIIYNGTFNPDFPPHYKLNSAISGTIVITPNITTKAESDLRVLILDTDTKEIVFYDRIFSSQYDPRIPYETEQMTKKILKKIYYK